MLETIALWWCYLTGGFLAWGFTVAAAWWALDTTMQRLGMVKLVLAWYGDRLKAEKRKTELPG
jgi:hypothetical protein